MKRLIKFMALVLVVSGLATGVVEASSNLDRIYGDNRIETAIEISKKAYPGKVQTVVLAGYTGEVDSLSGTILAHAKGAPMLITERNKLNSLVEARIKELGASEIYLLGGRQIISEGVENKLIESGYKVTRIGGSNREGTAIDIAKEVKGENIDEVFLTLGYDDYADALAINPVSGVQEKPIFLTQTKRLSPSTKEALEDLGVKKATIIGGNAVVSGKVEDGIQAMGISTDRVEGSNRFNTALKIAKKYSGNPTGYLIANGYKYADALIGGYFSAKNNKPILLVRDSRISDNNLDYLKANRLETIILGGEAVVKEGVYHDINIALKDPINIEALSIDGTKETYAPHQIGAKVNVNDKVLYKFSFKHENDKSWTIVQDYNSSNSAEWIPEKEGNYDYKVEAKYLNSKHVGAEKIGSIGISPLKPAELTSVELQGNKYKNTKHTIVAEATGTNHVLYKFYIQDKSTGNWTVIQDYSKENTADWTPKKHGSYRYTVRVKDENSDRVKDDLQGYDIKINAPVYYKTTAYDYTFEEALNKQNTRANKIYKGGKSVNANKHEVERYLNPKRFLQFEPGKEGHLISVQINNNNVDLKSSSSSSSKNLTTLRKGDVYIELDKKNGWHKVKANGKTGWISGRDVKYVNDVPNDMYQFMVLSGNLGVSPNQLNKYLKDLGILEGKGASFAEASRKHNINELYLIAHATLETGRGTSSLSTGILVKEVPKPKLDEDGEEVKDDNGNVIMVRQPVDNPKKFYNMYGIDAVDNDADRRGSEKAYEMGWDTPEKAIVGGAEWISNDYTNGIDNQDTLYKMKYNPGGRLWKQYATDVAWATKQTRLMDNIIEISNDLDNVVLEFDIPQYK